MTAKEIEYRFTLVANNDDPHKADDHHRYVLPGNMTSYVVCVGCQNGSPLPLTPMVVFNWLAPASREQVRV